MGNCVICGASADGQICASHEQDVLFEFEGNRPDELTPGRYYQGTVDGFAEFGVFVDIGDNVTGLLHKSELDRRLDSLDWDSGDAVFVEVIGVRDNGNVDLGWSIRQSDREFRGNLVDDGQRTYLPDDDDDESATDDQSDDDRSADEDDTENTATTDGSGSTVAQRG